MSTSESKAPLGSFDNPYGCIPQRPIWVVQMRDDRNGKWEPTIGVAGTRKTGRLVLARWRCSNPDDTFRLRAYTERDF